MHGNNIGPRENNSTSHMPPRLHGSSIPIPPHDSRSLANQGYANDGADIASMGKMGDCFESLRAQIAQLHLMADAIENMADRFLGTEPARDEKNVAIPAPTCLVAILEGHTESLQRALSRINYALTRLQQL